MDTEGPRTLVSPEEARLLGVEVGTPPIPKCPHCGRELEPRGVCLAGRVIWVAAARCGCEGEAEEERGRVLAEKAQEDERRDKRLRESGIPPRFMSAQPVDPGCRGYAAAFSRSSPVGAFIHGPVGVGKTYNAAGIAIAACELGARVVFTSALDALSSIQETFTSGQSSRRELERLLRCDLLVLDDLGKESASRWSLSTLFEIVNGRYERLSPTVLTSQYDLRGLKARLGQRGEVETADAIASRIAETCVDIVLSGPDRRNAGMTRATAPRQGGGRLYGKF